MSYWAMIAKVSMKSCRERANGTNQLEFPDAIPGPQLAGQVRAQQKGSERVPRISRRSYASGVMYLFSAV